MTRSARLALMLAAVAPAAACAQGAAVARPPGVTDSIIAVGQELFHGSAGCVRCHGDAGTGTDEGPRLTDAVWLRGDGSLAHIRKTVVHGVPKRESVSGVTMPIRGWQPLNDFQVDAVASYVWSISHPPRQGPAPAPTRKD
ncbi:MAG: c-type cytochrome [Gemmatimonadales bacterium]|nr:c-type cytochrome [Gemmatimonadales bacterium]